MGKSNFFSPFKNLNIPSEEQEIRRLEGLNPKRVR